MYNCCKCSACLAVVYQEEIYAKQVLGSGWVAGLGLAICCNPSQLAPGRLCNTAIPRSALQFYNDVH